MHGRCPASVAPICFAVGGSVVGCGKDLFGRQIGLEGNAAPAHTLAAQEYGFFRESDGEIGPRSGVGLRLPDGDIARGEQEFQELGCSGCHAIAGEVDSNIHERGDAIVGGSAR